MFLLGKELQAEVTLILKDREAYSREPEEGLTLDDEVTGVLRAAEEKGLTLKESGNEPSHSRNYERFSTAATARSATAGGRRM